MQDGEEFFIKILDLLFGNWRWYRKRTRDTWCLITSASIKDYGYFWIRLHNIYKFYEDFGEYLVIAIERHEERNKK